MEAGHAEGGSLHPFDQIVDSFSRSLADLGLVPGGDLVSLTQPGPAQGADFDRAGLVLEVMSKTLHEDGGEVGMAVVVYGTNYFHGVPGGTNLAVGVPALSRPSSLVRPWSSRRSSALVNRRRHR